MTRLGKKIMQISEITNQIDWTTFLNNCSSPSFLQSWEWGSLQEKLGYKILRLGLYDSVIPAQASLAARRAGIQSKNNLVATTQVIKIKAKRGNMLFVPQGPVVRISNDKSQITNQFQITKQVIEKLQNYLVDIAKREGYSFVRIAPILQYTAENKSIFSDLGFRTSPIYMHAERVWELDITKPDEQLLAEMRKTTRYSIRRAEKEGAVIEKSTDKTALGEFWEVYKETAKREEFTPFSKKFIQNEFNVFNETNNALILLGKLSAKTEAGALIVFTKSTAFYHQGASLHSKIPVAYLMQWEAIKEAKRRGCTRYSFWGTLQPGRSPKSWGGLSLFKQGFGGFQTDYVPTQDYIVSWKYWISYVYELYLKHKRGV